MLWLWSRCLTLVKLSVFLYKVGIMKLTSQDYCEDESKSFFFFKSLLYLLYYCFCFMVFFFFLIRPGIEPHLLHWKAKSQPPDRQASPRRQEILYWEPACTFSHSVMCVHIVSAWTVAHRDRLCPWDSPGKDTGVNCHALLQPRDRTLVFWVSSTGMWILYQLCHLGGPYIESIQYKIWCVVAVIRKCWCYTHPASQPLIHTTPPPQSGYF